MIIIRYTVFRNKNTFFGLFPFNRMRLSAFENGGKWRASFDTRHIPSVLTPSAAAFLGFFFFFPSRAKGTPIGMHLQVDEGEPATASQGIL